MEEQEIPAFIHPAKHRDSYSQSKRAWIGLKSPLKNLQQHSGGIIQITNTFKRNICVFTENKWLVRLSRDEMIEDR